MTEYYIKRTGEGKKLAWSVDGVEYSTSPLQLPYDEDCSFDFGDIANEGATEIRIIFPDGVKRIASIG